jgi:phosphoribosyl 1,2-cyclic phosphate phosphodiesterase
VIGCDCAVCESADPRDKRTRASIYVETPELAFVVDTGPDFRTQALRERVRRVGAVLYTHSHTDHVMGFDDLRSFCWGGQPMPIYAAPPTMQDLERVFVFAFNGQNRWPGYVLPEPHLIEGPFSLGETTVTPLPIVHGRAHMLGFLFSRKGERLAAYLTDCKEVPAAVIEQIHGVRHLIVDALRYKPHPTHMNVEEALAVHVQVAPARTWFTHLCHDLGHATTEPTLPDGVRLAYDGLKIEA